MSESDGLVSDYKNGYQWSGFYKKIKLIQWLIK